MGIVPVILVPILAIVARMTYRVNARVGGHMVRAIVIVLVFGAAVPGVARADGNAARGQRVFQNCAACHSLEPGKNMTGPSLANLWNRKAGTQHDFSRYSAAL